MEAEHYIVSSMTITLISKTKVFLNLYNIATFLPINDEIIGIQYTFDTLIERGCYNTVKKSKNKSTKKFYNQMSIIVHIPSKNINIKVFSNGTLNLSGCKTTDDAKKVIEIMNKYYQILHYKFQDCSETFLDKNNVPLVFKNKVVSLEKRQIIGYKSENDYIIHGELFTFENSTFVLKKFSKNRKILNLDGEYIGNKVVCVNRDILYKSYVIKDDSINNMYGKNVGYIRTVYNKDSTKPTNTALTNLKCHCTPFNSKVHNALDYDTFISCINIKMHLDFKVNCIKASKALQTTDMIIKYTPDTYSGIRCIFRKTVGKITFILFSTGNIIASGFKNHEEIDVYTRIFLNNIETLKDSFAVFECV